MRRNYRQPHVSGTRAALANEDAVFHKRGVAERLPSLCDPASRQRRIRRETRGSDAVRAGAGHADGERAGAAPCAAVHGRGRRAEPPDS